MARIVSGLLGKGIKYPFIPSRTNGVSTNEWIDRINQSLFILFSTRKGTRLMNPEFGSNIENYRFDPLDSVLLDKLEYEIENCIKLWEKRINIDKIDFNLDSTTIDNHILYITINYSIINTDVVGNYVYPFRTGTQPTYIKEIESY